MTAVLAEGLRPVGVQSQSNELLGVAVPVLSEPIPGIDQQFVLTVRERDVKKDVEEGSRGILQETTKMTNDHLGIAETADDTVLGAMGEIVGPHDATKVAPYLHRVLGMVTKPIETFGGLYRGGIAVVIFSGREFPQSPTAEVDNPLFLPTSTIMDSDNKLIRPTSREAVRHAVENKLFTRGLQLHESGLTVPVFSRPQEFSSFLKQRNEKFDISLKR